MRVIVFGREPSGAVKTRLAAGIGQEAARLLYRAFLDDACAAAAEACRQLGATGELHGVGAGIDLPAVAARHGLSYRAQVDGDLGARMEAALLVELPALLIGSDAPTATAADLLVAATALAEHDVVIGPSEDGGYWLVGLRRSAPIFDGMMWSSPTVLAETLDRAPQAHLVARHRDIDEAGDLTMVISRLRELPDLVAPATRRALYQLETMRGRPEMP